ncbi:MAG: hypothetical protein MJ237_06210 [bacterium]|nr:hypothetical protein [bacterium]
MEKNYNIILCAEPENCIGTDTFKGYKLYYRINPDELNWFQRTFGNPWKEIYQCIYDEMFPITFNDESRFQKYKNRFKTTKDIEIYENNEYEQMLKMQERIGKHKERKTLY